MITALLIAAGLAGQTPVDPMISACRSAMDSQSGESYFAPAGLEFYEPGYDLVLDRKERSLKAVIIFEASRRGLDVAQTEKVCWAMIVSRLEGLRDGLDNQVVITTTR
jgi:hypothetical protein